MYTTKDKKGHIKVEFDLDVRGRMVEFRFIDFVFFEILDLEKVRIDTEILSVLYRTRDTEGHNSIYL